MTADDARERLGAWYGSLADRARTLYAEGRGAREVLRECYGAPFPDEFFVLRRERFARPHLMANFTGVPWDLADEDGPPATVAGLTVSAEARLLDLDADLVPVLELIGYGTKLDRTVLCYRLTELRAGRTTVYACGRFIRPGKEPPRSGTSLLEVLHRHHTEFAEHEEWLFHQPWNRGFGAIDERSVEEARALLERVEALRDEVG